jgi:hypothetical protein
MDGKPEQSESQDRQPQQAVNPCSQKAVILSDARRGPQRQVFVAGVGSGVEGPAVVLRPEQPEFQDSSIQPSLTLEAALALLGETCVDVYLNGDAHWSAVPINVWNYTLGGYQVLKKWLSYREFTPEPASPLLHRPLHAEEAAYFAQVVRRIAAILLLGPALDASYRAILPTATGLPAHPTR